MKILIGGSPCTHWSIARTSGRETTAEGIGWELFKNYVTALKKYRPDYFLYENNKSMSQAIRAQITAELGVEPVSINSALVSAQNRQRLYWVGRREPDGTYSQVHIEQPEDRGILLRDILETATDEKCYALAEPVEARCVAQRGRYIGENGSVEQHYEAREDGKTNTITTVQKDNLVAMRIGTIENDAKNQDHDSQQYRVYSPDAKSVTLCGNGGGLGAKTGLYAVPTNPNVYGEFEGEGADGKKITIYEVRQGLITVKGKRWPIKLKDGYYIIRKLTVTECKRLQTVPDEYDFPTSDSQAYKMLGNGWTVDVIAHIMSHFNGLTAEPVEVLSMYDGMSCGHIALDKLGAEITAYYATEIDKYAIQTTQHYYPDTVQMGDAFQVREDGWKLPERTEVER